jgi:hypothetical protein
MPTRRTRTYTRRADAVDSGNPHKKERLKALQSLKRPLKPEELAELGQLMRELGGG